MKRFAVLSSVLMTLFGAIMIFAQNDGVTVRWVCDEKTGKEYISPRSDALYSIDEVRSLLNDKKREIKAEKKK